jgi:hypothetical protein
MSSGCATQIDTFGEFTGQALRRKPSPTATSTTDLSSVRR